MQTYQVYDHLAKGYDARYLNEVAAAENARMAELILELSGASPHLLDVGAGTGLALELGLTEPAYYTGVEPSAGMSIEFLKKFAGIENFHVSTFETFQDLLDPTLKYDLVISLFGSPSYIRPPYLRSLVERAPKAVMMHYIPGYLPDYEFGDPVLHSLTEKSGQEAARLCKEFAGESFILNNFQVTVFGGEQRG